MDKAILGASLALVSSSRVLLICRARDPFRFCWTLPGGRIEQGEDPEDCARREIREELGLELGAVELLTVLETETEDRSFRLAVFGSGQFAGQPRPSDEIADWAWTSLPDVSGLRTTPGLLSILAAALARFG